MMISSDLDLFYGKVKVGNLGFSSVDFLKTVAASDLKVSRSSHLTEYMKVCVY